MDDKSTLVWIFLLGLGFPLLGLLLEEIVGRLQQQQHPLAGALRKIRQYLLPPLAVLLVMTQVLELAEAKDAIRTVETITWLAVLFAAVPFLNATLTTGKPIKWQLKVPNLFFQVSRALLVLAIGTHILGGVWGVNLKSLAAAAGVGSLVVALALQDTLSNLVSGFLLLLARPFRVGDWIDVDGIQARVIDQNWWSVTLEERFWEYKITIPNSVLAQATITNYGSGSMWKNVTASFSYDDPPNQVIPALKEVVSGLDRIQSQGLAGIGTYEDSSINYDLWYKIRPEDNWKTSNDIKARIYYLAKRKKFTIYPIQLGYEIDSVEGIPNGFPKQTKNISKNLIEFLKSLPYFFSLSQEELETLIKVSDLQEYGLGEVIIKEGEPDDDLYILYGGSVKAFTQSKEGAQQELGLLSVGEAFGEMALFPGEVSPITVMTLEDSEILMIPDDVVVQLIQGNNQFLSNPKFAADMLQFINERKRELRIVKGMIEDSSGHQFSHNGLRQILAEQ